MRSGFFATQELSLDGFRQAWYLGRFNVYYRNSIDQCTKVPAGILVASLAAYPLAKEFPAQTPSDVFGGDRSSFHVTPFLTASAQEMGLLDTLAGLFFPYIAYGLPLQILVCRGFFRTIPDELIDALTLMVV